MISYLTLTSRSNRLVKKYNTSHFLSKENAIKIYIKFVPMAEKSQISDHYSTFKKVHRVSNYTTAKQLNYDKLESYLVQELWQNVTECNDIQESYNFS